MSYQWRSLAGRGHTRYVMNRCTWTNMDQYTRFIYTPHVLPMLMDQVDRETVSSRELIQTTSQYTQRCTIYRFVTCILFRDMPSVTAPCERAPLIWQQLRMRTPRRYSAARAPMICLFWMVSRGRVLLNGGEAYAGTAAAQLLPYQWRYLAGRVHKWSSLRPGLVCTGASLLHCGYTTVCTRGLLHALAQRFKESLGFLGPLHR